MAASRTQHGRVVDFDEHVGLGTVEADDGRRLAFHCTAISDGTRRIAVGAEVTFGSAPARGGRWEATAVTPARG